MLAAGSPGGPEALLRTDDADRVQLDWTITVPPDQLAVASGDLLSDTIRDGRREFRYRTRQPELWQPAVVMGHYAVARETWTPTPATARAEPSLGIEVYHHPDYDRNVRRIVDAARFALEQLSSWLGPYPHSVLRIVEAPAGLSPERVSGGLLTIPEHRAWVHDYRTEPAFDWIQFLVARQLAHAQLDQVAPAAAAPGALLVDAALPELLALLVLEARQGGAQLQRARHELLERYRRGRALHEGPVPSLLDADGEEFLAAAGSLALLRARERAGADRFRARLSGWVERARSSSAGSSARELASALRLSAETSDPALLDDFIGARWVLRRRVAVEARSAPHRRVGVGMGGRPPSSSRAA